ncbi:hypothetical protein TU94_00785 [Streptomyces cyaneogriseus subsp. noncyanogenus]|uniref:Uncharacterized protein n=1 Tax=Streptomyces cyaneogriseus subsp. noncyanogenus TaxID=477245 RepID=A0A0C5FWY1_9ACTN|nr:hypothetical protein [Streptomyces cyaneogriseus]AJP00299.1 hypothetical protein TU94_00785 [Streptomyces cyaneogriseus subsp. noncyanogenus]
MTTDTTDTTGTVPPAEAAAPTGADALKQQLVESLMGVIGAPDDLDTARRADDVLRTLDTQLARQPTAA